MRFLEFFFVNIYVHAALEVLVANYSAAKQMAFTQRLSAIGFAKVLQWPLPNEESIARFLAEPSVAAQLTINTRNLEGVIFRNMDPHAPADVDRALKFIRSPHFRRSPDQTQWALDALNVSPRWGVRVFVVVFSTTIQLSFVYRFYTMQGTLHCARLRGSVHGSSFFGAARSV